MVFGLVREEKLKEANNRILSLEETIKTLEDIIGRLEENISKKNKEIERLETLINIRPLKKDKRRTRVFDDQKIRICGSYVHHENRWSATIFDDDKKGSIGTFDSKEECEKEAFRIIKEYNSNGFYQRNLRRPRRVKIMPHEVR